MGPGKWGGVLQALVLAANVAVLANGGTLDLHEDLQVVHVSVLFVHGQRSRLVNTLASEFGDDAGVSLTAVGEEQAYQLGINLRERYIKAPNGTAVTTIVEGTEMYDSARVQVWSSAYDCALESAQAMALGLYPPGTKDEDEANTTLLPNDHIIVPVHSTDPQNDATILASDLCPVYTDNWQEFYRTTEFQEKQTLAADFIGNLYREFDEVRKANREPECWQEVQALNDYLLEFHSPYNLWDCATVLRNAGEPQTVELIDIVNAPTSSSAKGGWDYLETLVFWIEDRKFEQEVAGRMLGGLYVTQMLTRFMEVIDHVHSSYSPSVGRFRGLHLTAGHYHTLKGLEAALGTGGIAGVPDPTSHIAIELIHNKTADYAKGERDFSVRILYQIGEDTDTLKVLKLGMIWDPSSTLTLDSAVEYNNRDSDNMEWELWTYLMDNLIQGNPAYYPGGEAEWCEDCQTGSVDTCIEMELAAMTNNWETAVADTQDAVGATNDANNGIEGYHVALLSLFGVIMGVGIGICIRPCIDRRTRKGKADGSVSGDRGLEGWGNGFGQNGSFRLGVAKKTRAPSRHVMIGGERAMGVHTAADLDYSAEMDDEGAGHVEMGDPSRIPAFSSASGLGEPVPFPHRAPASLRGINSAPLSPGGDADNGSGYVVSPVPANGRGNGYSEKVMGAGGGSWEVNGVQEDWGNINQEDGDPYLHDSHAPTGPYN